MHRGRLAVLAEQLGGSAPHDVVNQCSLDEPVTDLGGPLYARQALLRPGALQKGFDQDAWERDGFVVLPGCLTDWATKQFSAELRRIQAIDDHIILHTDWRGTDWPSHGIPHTKARESITQAQLLHMRGGQERGFNLLPAHKVNRSWNPSKQHSGLWDDAPIAFPAGVHNEGLLPSRFSLAYSPFLWDVTTLAHPEFREIQERLLGTTVEDIRMDHVHCLNRRGPDSGRTWHAHPYDQDGFGVTERYSGLGLVRTLCYPQGCGLVEGDGGLSLIKGAHLYRDPFCWNAARLAGTDEAMERAWLRGRTHPRTGEPLAIAKLKLPPGSLVCFGHHMPHFVDRISEEQGTRLGLLMVYRRPDPKGRLHSCDRNIPDEWVARGRQPKACGGKPLTLEEKRLFSEF